MDKALPDFDRDIDLQCYALVCQIPIPSKNLEEIKNEIKNDEVFQKLIDFIENGWPNKGIQIDARVRQYHSIKDELNIVNGIIFKNKRILIPQSLRKKMLKFLHEGHMGISGCQNLARASIFWPNINNDIYNMVSNCDICLKYRNSNPKQELKSYDIPNIPWYKVGCDLFEFGGKTYLVVVDYYSRYFEVEFLNLGCSARYVITKLKSIFARHGIPAVIISDN